MLAIHTLLYCKILRIVFSMALSYRQYTKECSWTMQQTPFTHLRQVRIKSRKAIEAAVVSGDFKDAFKSSCMRKARFKVLVHSPSKLTNLIHSFHNKRYQTAVHKHSLNSVCPYNGFESSKRCVECAHSATELKERRFPLSTQRTIHVTQ